MKSFLIDGFFFLVSLITSFSYASSISAMYSSILNGVRWFTVDSCSIMAITKRGLLSFKLIRFTVSLSFCSATAVRKRVVTSSMSDGSMVFSMSIGTKSCRKDTNISGSSSTIFIEMSLALRIVSIWGFLSYSSSISLADNGNASAETPMLFMASVLANMSVTSQAIIHFLFFLPRQWSSLILLQVELLRCFFVNP